MGHHRSSRKLGTRMACAILALAAGLPAATANAQSQERRIERAIRQAEGDENFRVKVDTDLSVAERSTIDVGGTMSFAFLYLTDAAENSRTLLQPELSFYGRAIIDGGHRFFGRARFQYREFSEGDSFDGDGDEFTQPFHERYWYELDTRALTEAQSGYTPETNFNLRVGRQYIDWGAGLVLSDTLFAVRARWEDGPLSVTALAGFTPTDESFVDFDASRADFNEETERAFFGGRVNYKTEDGKDFYVYGLHQQDNNDDTRPTAAIALDVDFEYNSTYVGVGSRGAITNKLLYEAEFVYEFGESQSDPLRGPQTDEEIQAWAARAVLTYFNNDRFDTRWQIEGVVASGDDDRFVSTDTVGGNQSGTDDTGFNAFGFVNTGLAFSPTVSNLALARVGVSGFPFRTTEGFERFQVGADLFFISKLDEDAPGDEPTTSDAYLGTEVDLFVNYRVTSDLAFSARYGMFFPGDAIARETEVRHFLFFGATLSF
ncbi:MAG: alginate export family protein [Phycisphaerales bacterium]